MNQPSYYNHPKDCVYFYRFKHLTTCLPYMVVEFKDGAAAGTTIKSFADVEKAKEYANSFNLPIIFD